MCLLNYATISLPVWPEHSDTTPSSSNRSNNTLQAGHPFVPADPCPQCLVQFFAHPSEARHVPGISACFAALLASHAIQLCSQVLATFWPVFSAFPLLCTTCHKTFFRHMFLIRVENTLNHAGERQEEQVTRRALCFRPFSSTSISSLLGPSRQPPGAPCSAPPGRLWCNPQTPSASWADKPTPPHPMLLEVQCEEVNSSISILGKWAVMVWKRFFSARAVSICSSNFHFLAESSIGVRTPTLPRLVRAGPSHLAPAASAPGAQPTSKFQSEKHVHLTDSSFFELLVPCSTIRTSLVRPYRC